MEKKLLKEKFVLEDMEFSEAISNNQKKLKNPLIKMDGITPEMSDKFSTMEHLK